MEKFSYQYKRKNPNFALNYKANRSQIKSKIDIKENVKNSEKFQQTLICHRHTYSVVCRVYAKNITIPTKCRKTKHIEEEIKVEIEENEKAPKVS